MITLENFKINTASDLKFRERRHPQWTENYELYRDTVITNCLTQRQSVNVPFMKETIKTILANIDDAPAWYLRTGIKTNMVNGQFQVGVSLTRRTFWSTAIVSLRGCEAEGADPLLNPNRLQFTGRSRLCGTARASLLCPRPRFERGSQPRTRLWRWVWLLGGRQTLQGLPRLGRVPNVLGVGRG